MGRASFVRESADVRRQALIDATARCLAERGAGGASVRVICAMAGVSPGLLTHYYDGIEALILATYRDVGRRVGEAMDAAAEAAGSDPRARLDAYATASFLPPVLDPDLLATWVAFWSLVKSTPPIAQAHAEIYAAYRDAMQALIAACRPGMAPDKIRLNAVAITALVDGFWLELCLDTSSFTAQEACEMTRRWISDLLGD